MGSVPLGGLPSGRCLSPGWGGPPLVGSLSPGWASSSVSSSTLGVSPSVGSLFPGFLPLRMRARLRPLVSGAQGRGGFGWPLLSRRGHSFLETSIL